MSYEGYCQVVCVKGHYFQVESDVVIDDIVCQICGDEIAWFNNVNTTNGSYDGDNRIDGYIALECISENFCICDSCGVEHRSGAPIFQIPKNGGHFTGKTKK